MSGPWAESISLVMLAVVLVFAMLTPRGLPEAFAAVPTAVALVGIGAVTLGQAGDQIRLLGPTVGFLAAILMLATLADVHGVFRWLGSTLAAASHARPTRTLSLVFVAASVTTAVLSLDATVVLLTPVVIATARHTRLEVRPHAYACAHLSNTASLVLPVSNLTNLLAFSATRLSFAAFAALMVLPWLTAIAIEYVILRWFFRKDLADHSKAGVPPDVATAGAPPPVLPLAVLAVTLAGFGLSGLVGIEPLWVALLGVGALAVPALKTGLTTARGLLSAASPLFCLFVLALGIIVAGVTTNGLGHAVAALMPSTPTPVHVLAVAVIAALLANLVNNLPATLLMLAALGQTAPPGLVLAMLLGVNIGPNLTYVGSLATLLWRKVLQAEQITPRLREFTLLGAITVPMTLLGAAAALALGLHFLPH